MMKKLGSVIFSVIFIASAFVYLLVFNANRTFLRSEYAKNVFVEADFYNKISWVFKDVFINNNPKMSKEEVALMLFISDNILTPETVKNHTESIINQTFSLSNSVSEDFLDINSKINAVFLIASSDSGRSIIPPVNFNKQDSAIGRLYQNRGRVCLISLIISIISLILLIILCADNLKSRLRWVGGSFLVVSFLLLFNIIFLKIANMEALVHAVVLLKGFPVQVVELISLMIEIAKRGVLSISWIEFDAIFVIGVILLAISYFVKDSKRLGCYDKL